MSSAFNQQAHQRAVVVAQLQRAGLPTNPWAAFERLVARETAKGAKSYDAMIAVGKSHPALWEVLRTEPRQSVKRTA